MTRQLALFLTLTTLLLVGCNSSSMITAEELRKQNEADNVVSSVLFDHDVADVTSYKIQRDGHVILNFARSVDNETYTAVVLTLRQKNSIRGVSASQDGSSICALP